MTCWTVSHRAHQPARLTERVPWHEAVGARRQMRDAFGFEFTVEAAAWDEDENLNVENRDGSRTFPVDPDGTVEVLVDGES